VFGQGVKLASGVFIDFGPAGLKFGSDLGQFYGVFAGFDLVFWEKSLKLLF
jgi:hypothetical protein